MKIHIKLPIEDLNPGMMIKLDYIKEPVEITSYRQIGNSPPEIWCRDSTGLVRLRLYEYAICDLDTLLRHDSDKIRKLAYRLLKGDPKPTEEVRCLIS
jgi:hypothetical protein